MYHDTFIDLLSFHLYYAFKYIYLKNVLVKLMLITLKYVPHLKAQKLKRSGIYGISPEQG